MPTFISAQLLFLESENPDKDIHLYINSAGGSPRYMPPGTTYGTPKVSNQIWGAWGIGEVRVPRALATCFAVCVGPWDGGKKARGVHVSVCVHVSCVFVSAPAIVGELVSRACFVFLKDTLSFVSSDDRSLTESSWSGTEPAIALQSFSYPAVDERMCECHMRSI